jgi:hypothetical protein
MKPGGIEHPHLDLDLLELPHKLHQSPWMELDTEGQKKSYSLGWGA